MVSSSLLSSFSKEILSALLLDRTAGRNILWATGDYSQFGIDEKSQMKPEQIFGETAKINLIPRCQKQREKQADRTRERAEVFTPSWVCNEQNNLVDEAWFGRKGVFNSPDSGNPKKWIPTAEKIIFDADIESGKTWRDYVNAARLEITCGEAPYLASRYDTTSGKSIKLEARIGLLDRKLRVVRENVESEADYFIWTEKSFQNIYGFELSGDNLILARANLLLTFIENTKHFLKRNPTEGEESKIAEIISWNLWQMDGLTFKTPFSSGEDGGQLDLFGEESETENFPCRIMDWKKNKTVLYKSLAKEA